MGGGGNIANGEKRSLWGDVPGLSLACEIISRVDTLL
jgi:hypothetical protein